MGGGVAEFELTRAGDKMAEALTHLQAAAEAGGLPGADHAPLTLGLSSLLSELREHLNGAQ